MQVLIVDDHPIVRHGLAQLLLGSPAIKACIEAGTIAQAMHCIETYRIDAVVLDLSLGPESGLDLVISLRIHGNPIPVLVLSMHDETLHAERALRAGANGYLIKGSASEHVVDAVLQVAAGQTVLSPCMGERLAGATSRTFPPSCLEALTRTELAVLGLIGKGLSTGEIAAQRFRSVKTIEAQRETIKRKLGLRSAAELMRFAVIHARQ